MYLLIAALVLVVVIICIAYSVSAAYQQTLTITVPFQETYRYAPSLNKDYKFKLEAIKLTVTGSIKKDSVAGSTISPGSRIKDIILENVINPYANCLLVQEANTFIVEENLLKRCPITKNPSLENLSVMFFNKLAPLMPLIGCQLVSVKLTSEGLNVTHSRYKISDYSV